MFPTEQVNPDTAEIDRLSTPEILAQINRQDRQVPEAVAEAIPAIAIVVDRVVVAFSQGGRLFYVGAGTSGRLGVLDAAECPPTFSTDPAQVQGIIAGGEDALKRAVEGAEDDPDRGRQDILNAGVQAGDVVMGISASGGATYVVAAMAAAREKGCFTAGMTCHGDSPLAKAVDQPIVTRTGPEVIAGSTRMKAGTAQKLVLNMISTAAMIQWGKTYGNLMVDVAPTNRKLRDRAERIVAAIAGVPQETAAQALKTTEYQVKPAIVMLRCQMSLEEARQRLEASGGKLRVALD